MSIPREQDTQKNEVIVDNDTRNGSIYLEMKSRKARWGENRRLRIRTKKTCI